LSSLAAVEIRQDKRRSFWENKAPNETDSLVSALAKKKADKREISKADVEQTIMQSDSTMRSQPPRQIFMRRYLDEVLQTEMLLRVIVEETDAEMAVVTLYKTSKFRKYEPGA